MELSKRLFVQTFGCQMNVYDSARMADVLAPLGYRKVGKAYDADMVILNTCHIREKAADKVYSELGRLRRLKETRRARGGSMVIVVAGCVAQAEGEEIRRRAPFVDIVVGPQSYHRLPRILAELANDYDGAVVTDFPPESKFDHLPEERAPQGVSAFLTVQEGCDKFCTFCVVPYTRGAEYSRPVMQIIDEAQRLVDMGAREITLLGQNVNAYHGCDERGREIGLGDLIRRLDSETDVTRLRYTTSHPRDMNDELIAVHGEVPALMPYLHLPVQSGSERILAAMNRGHRLGDYHRLIERLRSVRPDIALSSDFIVGYPGETDTEFTATLDLARKIGYAQAYSFKYSQRPGTPASEALSQVDENVKEARLADLQTILSSTQESFNRQMLNRDIEVLFERPGRRPGQLLGRSPHNQAVHVEAPSTLIGALSKVRIRRTKVHSLEGAIVSYPANNAPGVRACV